MRKSLKYLKPAELVIWIVASVTITAAFFVLENHNYHYLIGALIGVSALVFVSKGNPVGQILTIVFAVFYGIISFTYSYYGEMITYLGMSAPMALAAFIAWIRNPYKKGESEVKVIVLSKRERIIFPIVGAIVTVAFYFILRALGTANLAVSTLSVLTSFLAAYLTLRRNRFYAVAYAANDVVLIAMWVLAAIEDITYLPMIICFVAFLVLDVYGFINWSRMLKWQSLRQDSFRDKEERKGSGKETEFENK